MKILYNMFWSYSHLFPNSFQIPLTPWPPNLVLYSFKKKSNPVCVYQLPRVWWWWLVYLSGLTPLKITNLSLPVVIKWQRLLSQEGVGLCAHPSSPSPPWVFCLDWVCIDIIPTVTVMWIYMCNRPVLSEKHCFLEVICHFWLLQSSAPIFTVIHMPCKKGVIRRVSFRAV